MIPNSVIEEKKNGARAQLETAFANAEAKGMPIVSGGTTYHLQCRPLDRTNWLGVKAIAEQLPNDTDTMVLMTYEDVPITLTKVEVLQAMLNIGAYSQALYGARWATKEAINSTGVQDVQAYLHQALQAILA